MKLSNPSRTLKRRGANAVEFALLLPVLMTMTFAIADYSWYFMVVQGAQKVSREAVRTGAQVPRDQDAAAVATAKALERMALTYPANLMPATYNVTVENVDQLQVTVSLTINPLLGFVPVPSSYSTSNIRVLEDPP